MIYTNVWIIVELSSNNDSNKIIITTALMIIMITKKTIIKITFVMRLSVETITMKAVQAKVK